MAPIRNKTLRYQVNYFDPKTNEIILTKEYGRSIDVVNDNPNLSKRTLWRYISEHRTDKGYEIVKIYKKPPRAKKPRKKKIKTED